MAQTPPPGIDPVPAPAPQRGDRATFSNRVDAFILWLVAAVTQFQAVASNVYANALDAFASASAALGYRDAAQTARDLALTYRDQSLTYRNEAVAARDAAQNYAAALTGTSTSLHTVGTGAKTFGTQPGKQFANQLLRFLDPTNNARVMFASVTSYNSTTGALVVNVYSVNPAAAGQTSANWVITITGDTGATGPAGSVAGGNLTGALNGKRAADVPSAATVDIWSPAGDVIPITGSVTVTNFSAAPQAGAARTLLSVNGFPIQSNANIVVVGGTQTVVAGDELDVLAYSTTYFRVTVRKRDGRAVTSDRTLRNARMLRTSGVFVAPVTGLYKFTLAGQAGTGGLIVASGRASLAARATGAGGPGIAVKTSYLTAGQVVNISLPAAGPAVTQSVSSNIGLVPGSDGGNSTLATTGVSLQANGGKAGAAVYSTAAVAGGAGGTATGGDVNITGGRGGNIAALPVGQSIATGGGAPGIEGVGYNGGDVLASAAAAVASGGAGAGGNGGVLNGGTDVGQNASGGGGSGGSGVGIVGAGTFSLGGANADMELVATLAVYATTAFLNAIGGGSPGYVGSLAPTTPPTDGGGTGGVVGTGTNVGVTATSARFGGGPGIAYANTASGGNAVGVTSNSSILQLGGASGGIITTYSSSTITIRQSADAGWCYIEWSNESP